jgi:glutamine cyclotransferase
MRRTISALSAIASGFAFTSANAAAPLVTEAARPVTVLQYEIVNTYPHDRGAFTQGLIVRDGYLYEGTGLNGKSSLRKVKLETGEVLQREMLAAQYFGEGITDWGDELIQITWQSNIGFVYDLKTFKQKRSFTYAGEGWGITQDGKRLIMSDGTADLRFLDPKTFAQTGRLTVTYEGKPLPNLNELEVVKGKIFANIWGNNNIVVIDPANGRVVSRLDLTDLWTKFDRHGADVLNGIAYDSKRDRLFVTGKNWPHLFEIRIVPSK